MSSRIEAGPRVLKYRLLSAFFLGSLLFAAASLAQDAGQDRFNELQRQLTRQLIANRPVGEVVAQLQSLAETRPAGVAQAHPLHAWELRRQLQHFQVLLAGIARSDTPPEQKVRALVERYESLQAAHLLMNERFALVERRLTDAGAAGGIATRLHHAKQTYNDRLEAILEQVKAPLDEFRGSADPAALTADRKFLRRLRKAADEARKRLEHELEPAPVKILGNTFLPYSRLSLDRRQPDLTTAIQPAYLNADEAQTTPVAADLAGTADAPLSQEILAQAQALDYDYIRIYEFVKNEIHTEWYAGSLKGAVGALQQRSGNDVDQASLLIALFRASGLSARYIKGVVELPIEAVMDSLGLTAAAQATRALGQAGVAFNPVIRGGRVAAVNIEHTWVSAYVPYTNYRGAAVDTSGSIWLPLAPTLKAYEVAAAGGIFSEAGLSAGALIEDYLGGMQAEDPVSQIETRLTEYLQNTHPEASLEDRLGSIAVRPVSPGLLPATLPVTVVNVNREVAALPPEQQHRLRFVLRKGVNAADEIVLDYTTPLSAVAGNRVTLSYMPATVDDQAAVNAFGGLDLTPAYLIKLRPQLRINGRKTAVAQGDIDTGIPHRLQIEVLGPHGVERLEQTLLSGSYHAFAVTAGRLAGNSAEGNAQACTDPADPVCTGGEDPADTEYLGARLLSRAAYEYVSDWQAAETRLAGWMNLALLRPMPSIAIVSNEMRVDTVLGQPSQLRWEAVTLDASMRVTQPLSRDANAGVAAGNERDFMRLAALQGSSLEHQVFEELFLADSLSADKGLQLANAGQLQVLALDSGNFASQQSLLTHPANALADIRNWVDLGFVVTTPASAVAYHAWQGHVWRVEDPATGDSGYFIAGGLAGGSTAQPGDAWVLDYLNEALEAMNSPPPNLNPGQAASITMIPASTGQKGIAGQPLEQPLVVMVRDAANAPVKNAAVSFRVVAGGGNFDGRSVATALTNPFGLASIVLTLGQSTAEEPVYLKRNPDDEWVSKAGLNLVDASVNSDFGVLSIAQPFAAIAFPDVPAKLVMTSGLVLGNVPLGQAAAMTVQAQDQFGNPVSNVPTTFQAAAGPVIEECGVALPPKVLTRNGEGLQSTVGSGPHGTHATLIAGAGFSSYSLTASATGPAETPVVAAGGFGCSDCGSVVFRYTLYLNEYGDSIQAGRAGETLGGRLTSQAFVASDITGERSSTVFSVQHAALTAGATTGFTQYEGNGNYSYEVGTGTQPEFYRVNATVTNGLSAVEGAGLEACGGVSDDPQTFAATGAWGLLPRIESITSLDSPPGISANAVYVNADNRTEYPAEVRIDVQPEEYRSSSTELDFFEDGVWTGYRTFNTRAGQGVIVLPRGSEFDPLRTYEVEVVLNRGGPFEVRSERIVLPVRQNLIQDYSRQVLVRQNIDILNQRTCSFGTEFRFVISEDARITLEFADEISPASVTALIDNELYSEGEHSIDITPGDLTPGRYRFKLTAVAAADGLTESKPGIALVEFVTQNNLPVGHTVVKGVDVFDGNLSVSSQDLAVPGRGIPLALNRAYSSNASAAPGALGVGWTHNYHSRITITPCGEVIVIGAAGGGIRFVGDGQGGLTPLRGYHGSLIRNDAERSFDFYAVDGTRYHYRNFGRQDWDLVFIEDTNGNVTTLGYDPSSPEQAKLMTVQDAAGRRFEFTYETRSFTGHFEAVPVVTQVELIGADVPLSVAYEYDAFGNLIRAARRDAEDNTLRDEQYTYNVYELDNNGEPVLDDNNDPVLLPIYARHKLNTYTDPNGNLTAYEYEQTRQVFQTDQGVLLNAPYSSVIAVAEPAGSSSGVRTTRFEYDFSTRNTALSNPRGFNNGFDMNDYGSVSRLQRPAGATQTDWTAEDVLPVSRTDARNVRAAFSYDDAGNVLSETVASSFTRAFSYEAFDGGLIKNRLHTQVDRNGHVTTFEYDARGNLVKVTDAEGFVTEHTYNAHGDKVSTRDPNGNLTRFKYDAYGNLREVTDALGNVTTTEWNARGLPVKITDARGHVTQNSYDNLGRLLSARNALGGEMRFTYDAYGNKLSETDELNRTTEFEYDEQHRLIRVENARGDFRRFEYDANGNKTLERDWNGNVTAYEYDGDDRLIRRTEPEGRITTFTYDAVGNKLTETLTGPNGGRTTRFDYDTLNRVVQITDAEGGETTFTYDGEGNKLTETDAEGRVTTFEYDKNNRLVKMTDDEGGVTQFEYDANGNKTAEIDANGHRRVFEYDKLNRLVKTRDALGNATTHGYDSVGNLVSVIDANLSETRFEYDKLNRKAREIDPLNHAARFVYDAAGNLIEEHLPNGNTVTHTYDNLNRLTRSEDSLGVLLTKTYDANGNVTQMRDANNNLTVNAYDGLNRLTQQALPANRTLRFEYDVYGNKTRETDANNHATVFAYDRLNRLTAQTDPFDNSMAFTYDRVGNKFTETDKRDNTTTFAYDDLNRLVSITDALTQSVTMTYDAVGNKLTETDKRGTVTEFTYDKENRLLTTAKDGVQILRREYDAVGNKTLEEDANGNKVVSIYDKRNQLVEQSRPLAAITRFQYDAMGDKVQERDPEGRISRFGYDLRQRLTSQTNGANETETYEYDGNGNRTRLQRPEGNAWTYEYDAADRLIRITDQLNGLTAYTYDNNGNRLTQTDANQNTTTFEYDALNRRTKIVYADSNDVTFGYDENGNRTGMTDANGLSFTYVHDALNRETERTYPAPATPTGDDIQSIVSEYDENNNPTRITETYSGVTGTRVTGQRFDNFDRLIEKTDPNGEVIRYSFDANGNRKTVRDPDGKVTTYSYDALNRVSDVVNAQGVTNYRYDRSSLKTQVTYPNGTQARWTYDNAGRITTIENRQNTALVSSYEYSYDSNGNRTQQIETNGGAAETTTYDFDLNDRLIEVVYPDKTTTYTYDAAYNRKSELTTENTEVTEDKTYSYNSRNQVIEVFGNLDPSATASYGYDANGNRITKTVDGVVITFVYDVRDQLRQITQGGPSVGQFLYDYQGLRIRKQTQGETTRYVYDDQSVLIQTDDLGNTISKYDYGPDRLLSLTNATEGPQFYLFDALGSVVNLTKPNGVIQARYQYDAWGNYRNQVGSSENVFGFTGHEMDAESGLIYMKARFYDPELGQFLSQDAFEGIVDTPPSLHKYLYAYVNPLVYFDPDGNQVFKYVDENGVTVFTDRPPMLPKEEAQDRAHERNERLKQESTIDPFELDRQQREKARAREISEVTESVGGVGTNSAITDACNDPQCEVMNTRQRILDAQREGLKDAGEEALEITAELLLTRGVGKVGGKFVDDLLDKGKKAKEAIKKKVGDIRDNISALKDRFKRKSPAGDSAQGVGVGKVTKGVRYGPTNPGPLDDAVVATFRGGSYTATTVSETTTLYRVYGGSAGKLGPYWTRTKPSGPLQSQLDSALAPQWGNTAQNVASIRVPKGTTIYEGAAASQSTGVGQILGGGNQVYIPRVDPKWIQ